MLRNAMKGSVQVIVAAFFTAANALTQATCCRTRQADRKLASSPGAKRSVLCYSGCKHPR
jgi:hypothetical protein